MISAQPLAPPSLEAPAISSRILSIDIFRGLTMALMIFVNDLAGIKGLPWWTYHVPARVDAMSYVDMVFPFFLFIVGMSIPLAIKHRLKKNSSVPALWVHIAIRTFSLLVLGLILANTEKGDPARMHMNSSLWGIIALVGAILFWNVYDADGRHARLHRALRYSGLAVMIVMLVIFRRTTAGGETGWIDFSYPEILGLIGFSYLSVCILYVPTRRWTWAPLLWFITLLAFCAVTTAWYAQAMRRIPLYVWPFGNGAMPCLVMAGVVTSSIYLGKHNWSGARKAVVACVFALASLAGGWILTPLGISKIRATPTWCLYSIAAAVALFGLLYWICDVRKHAGWAKFVRPAGNNTLLTYLLPDFYYFAISALTVTYFNRHFNTGMVGLLRAVVFTAIVLGLAGLLTRAKLRLQL